MWLLRARPSICRRRSSPHRPFRDTFGDPLIGGYRGRPARGAGCIQPEPLARPCEDPAREPEEAFERAAAAASTAGPGRLACLLRARRFGGGHELGIAEPTPLPEVGAFDPRL